MSALTDYFSSLANKIRSKTGKSTSLSPNDMISEIDVVYSSGRNSVTSQTKSCTPSTSAQNIVPDSGYDYLNKVTVSAIQTQTKSCTPSTSAQTIKPDSGKFLSSVSVGAIQTQTKSCTPSTSAQTIKPDSGKFLSSVSVGAIQTESKTATAYQSYGAVKSVTPTSGKYLSIVTIPKFLGGSLSGFSSKNNASNMGNVNFRNISIGASGLYLFIQPIVPSGDNATTIDGSGITILKKVTYLSKCRDKNSSDAQRNIRFMVCLLRCEQGSNIYVYAPYSATDARYYYEEYYYELIKLADN